MGFNNLPKQSPIYPKEAEDYARDALLMSEEAAEQTRNVLDIKYGPDYWQSLDIYLPEDQSLADLPVLVFAHGGAWTHGYKEWMGLMGPATVELPAILVSVSYRLAPDHKFPVPVEDCISALRWVYDNIEFYGGSRDKIVVGGHSAGGHLYTIASLRPDLLAKAGLEPDVVKGCAPVCSQLNLVFDEPEPGSGEARIYEMFLANKSDDKPASPLHNVTAKAPPFFLSHGSEDFPRIMKSNEEFMDTLRDLGVAAEYHVVPGASHFGMALELAKADSPLSRQLHDFLLESTG